MSFGYSDFVLKGNEMKSVIVSWIFPIAFLIVVLGYASGLCLFLLGSLPVITQDSDINSVAMMCMGIGSMVVSGRLIDEAKGE